MFHYVSEVVEEVLLGILFWTIVGTAVILGIWGLRAELLTGFLLGAVMSAAYFIHLALTAETSVDLLSEKAAKNHTMSRYYLRLLVGAVIIFLAWKSGKVYMPMILFGLFTMKAGVYSRLVIHKLFQKFGKHLDVVSEEALEGARRWAEEEAAEKAAKKAAGEAAEKATEKVVAEAASDDRREEASENTI